MFDRTDDFMIVHEPISVGQAGFNAATERVVVRANVQEGDNSTQHFTVAEFFTTVLDGVEIVNAERAAMAFIARTRVLNRHRRCDLAARFSPNDSLIVAENYNDGRLKV